MTDCKNCNGEGWVCENHEGRAWGDGRGCCGGAGSPCAICNPCDDHTPPRPLAGSVEIWTAEKGWVN